MREDDGELPAHHERLELYGAALPAPGLPVVRGMDIPGDGDREVTGLNAGFVQQALTRIGEGGVIDAENRGSPATER